MILSNSNFKKYCMILAVILIVLILFNAFAVPAHAVDFVLTPAIIAVVGAALVACGFTFSNADQMSAVVGKVWDAIPDAAKTAFLKIADEYSAALQGGIGYVGYKLSSVIVSALKDWFTSANVDVNNGITVSYGGFQTTFDFNSYSQYIIPRDEFSIYMNLESHYEAILKYGYECGSCNGSPVYFFYYIDSSRNITAYLCFTGLNGSTNFETSSLNHGVIGGGYHYFNKIPADYSTTFVFSSSSPFISVEETSYVTYNYTTSPYQTFANWVLSGSSRVTEDAPCDVLYGPNSTDANAAGLGTDVVVSGKMLDTSGTLDSDYVGTMTTAGVRDLAGAEAAADSASLSGIKEMVGTIATAVTTFFNPAEFSLNFEGLKSGLTDLSNVFPFCIPFDMYRGIKLFASSSADFSLDINLDTDLLIIDHTVDLTPFRVPIAFFRYICVFWFSWILISRTRDLMKW